MKVFVSEKDAEQRARLAHMVEAAGAQLAVSMRGCVVCVAGSSCNPALSSARTRTKVVRAEWLYAADNGTFFACTVAVCRIAAAPRTQVRQHL